MASPFDRLKKLLESGTSAVRDVFDANTESDYYRREQAQVKANPTVAPVRQTYAQEQTDRGVGRVSNNFGARTINAGKSLWEGFKEAPEYVGKGLSYGSSQQQSTDQSIISQQNQRTQELARARMRLKDPTLSPTQRANYSKFVSTFGSDQDKINAQTEQMTQRNIAGTDPVRGAGYVASMGFDVATAGVGGGAGVTLKTAAKQGAKQFIKRAAVEGLKSGAVGAGSGALLAVGQRGRDVTASDIGQGALVGGAVGAALPVVSYGVGRGLSKVKSKLTNTVTDVVQSTDPTSQARKELAILQKGYDTETRPVAKRQLNKEIARKTQEIRDIIQSGNQGGFVNPKAVKDENVPVVFKGGEGKAYSTPVKDLYNQATQSQPPKSPLANDAPQGKTVEDYVPKTKTMEQSGNKLVTYETVDADGTRQNVVFKIGKEGKKTITTEYVNANGEVTGITNLGSYEKAAQKYGTKDPNELALRATTGEVVSYNKAGEPIWETKGNFVDTTAPQVGKTLTETRTNTTGVKNYNPDGLPKPANQIVHDLAGFYESTGSKQGVSIVNGKRISNNSPAYRELFAKLGRTPTSKDWYDYAYDQINNGTAPKEIVDTFERTLNSELLSDKSIQTPEALVPEGAKPIANQKPSNMSQEEWDSLVRTRVPDQQKVNVVRNDQGTLDIQKTTEAPISKKVTVEKVIPTTATPVIKDKPEADFTATTNKYLGSLQASDTTARALADNLPHKLTGQEAIDAIVARENGKPTGNIKIDQVNSKIKGIYDALYARYRDAGFDMGYVDNYSPRIYKNPKTGEAITKDEYLFVTRGTGRQVSRTLENVNPDHLLYKTPQELLAHYTKTFEKARAGREYFDNLKGQGYIVESGSRPDGMVVIDAPGMPQPTPRDIDGMQIQGNYYARPDVAEKLNKVFGIDRGNKVLDVTSKLASAAQDVGLSGGLPGTPLNSFAFAQLTRELAAGKLSVPLKAIKNSMSDKGSQAYFKDNASIVVEMQKQGINVSSGYNTKTLGSFGEQIKATEGKFGKAGLIWDKVMSDPTFKRFVPTLQVETYKQAKAKLTPKYGEAEASRIAGDIVKNFYGLTDLTTQATRSKSTNDALTTVMFAPKYRESMTRFWINNAKALKPSNMKKPEYAQNVRFNVGATLLFGAMQAANIALNGTPTWGNPDGKKDKLIVPTSKLAPGITGGKDIGIPFLSSIATVPRAIATGVAGAVTGNTGEVGKSAKSFLGYGIRPLVDLADNENYFGSRIYDPKAPTAEKLGSQASYLFKAYQQPYIREGLNAVSNKLPDSVKKFTGAKDQAALQTVAQTLESPLRFYDPNYYRGGSDSFQVPTMTEAQQSMYRDLPEDKKSSYLASVKNGDVQDTGGLKPDARRNTKDMSKPDFVTPTQVSMEKAKDKLPQGISDQATKVLLKYNALSEGGKKRFDANPKNSFDLNVAKFERDLAKGDLTEAQKITRATSLKKEAITSDYSKDVTSAYGLAKNKMYALISNNPDLEAKLRDYDQKLLNAGLIETSKFASTTKSSSKSGGSTAKAKKFTPPSTDYRTSVGPSTYAALAKLLASSKS